MRRDRPPPFPKKHEYGYWLCRQYETSDARNTNLHADNRVDKKQHGDE